MAVDPPGDPLGPQELICVFCWPYRDPVTDEVCRDCEMCVGRDIDRWCECSYCDWL